MLVLDKWFKLHVFTGLLILPSLVLLVVITLKIQKSFWIRRCNLCFPTLGGGTCRVLFSQEGIKDYSFEGEIHDA